MTAPKPPPRTLQPAEERQIQLFLERAAPLVLEDPNLTADRWARLADLAHELDLSAAQFRSTMDDLLRRGVIHRTEVDPPKPPPLPGKKGDASRGIAPSREGTASLPEPPPVPSRSPQLANPPIPIDLAAANRWRVEGAPAPVPPPLTKPPAELFLDFIRPSLAAARDGIVSVELEQRLLTHATRVLGLSGVFARHLLLDSVAERQMKFAGSPAVSAEPASVPATPAIDPRYAEFLQLATPILAQHRGLNPQSRILLASLGRERGWSSEEVERAISQLIVREPEHPTEPRQKERLAPFARYVEQQLKKSAKGIVSPALFDKLWQAGTDLFGVERGRVETTLRETIASLELVVVTHEQAEQHLRELLADLWPEGAKLRGGARERFELEGAQWGVSSSRLGALIEERSRTILATQRRELWVTRLALWGAGCSLATVVGFFIWTSRLASVPTAAGDPATSGSTGAGGSTAGESGAATASESTRRPPKSWTDSHADLAIALVIARSDVPPLRKPLADLASDDPHRRRTAYTALVEYLLGDANPVAKRRDMGMLLAQCLAADPAEDCVDHLLTQLLRSVPPDHGSTGFELPVVGQSFSAIRCVARGLADSAGDTTRAGRVTAALQRSIGMTPDPSLPASDLEQACLRGLAEHLFRQLIRAADHPLPQAAELRATMVVEAGPVLSPGQLEKHDAEFLATFLAANADRWPEFQELVAQRIASTDPLVVLKFIGLFENTTHDELRGFLRSCLVERAGGTPPKEEESVEEVAAMVRRALGIANAADPTGQWSKLNREARDVLAATQTPSDSADTLLADTLKLAHFSTLACAFVQNRWEQPEIAVERKNGPKTPQTGLAEARKATASATPEPPPSVTREQVEALRQTMSLLTSRRSQYSERVMALQRLGRLAETIADLPPDYAAQVASYLLDAKSATEHDKVLEQIPAISRWTQVLVAVADRVVEAPLTQPQLQTLLSRILSRDLSLTEGTPGREQGRRALQAYLLERVGAAPVPVEVATAPASPAENTPRLLADAYLLQARTLDLPIPEEAWKSRSPQKVLRHLIQELAHRQQAGELPSALKAELANLSAEITVSEYLAQDELQELVLLERSWIRVLGVEVVRRDQGKVAERTEIVQKLQAFDRNAKSALVQLREGHRTLLQLWLLLGKPLAR